MTGMLRWKRPMNLAFVGEYYGAVISSGEALRRTGEYAKDVEVES